MSDTIAEGGVEVCMLQWAEVKRLIARIMGPHLAALGFQNPGRSSRRFRPTFVDVIWFESRRQGCFKLEFACGVRDFLRNNPAPWHCPFRTAPAYSFGWADVDWHFRASATDQAAMLEDLAPRVVEDASVWFGYFTTVESAIHAFNVNEWSGPRHVADCAPGSPAYEQTIAELRAVKAEGKGLL